MITPSATWRIDRRRSIVVFWIRSGLEETRSYLAAAGEANRGSTLALMREHPKETAAILRTTSARTAR